MRKTCVRREKVRRGNPQPTQGKVKKKTTPSKMMNIANADVTVLSPPLRATPSWYRTLTSGPIPFSQVDNMVESFIFFVCISTSYAQRTYPAQQPSTRSILEDLVWSLKEHQLLQPSWQQSETFAWRHSLGRSIGLQRCPRAS